jgi:DNA repair exonuclease SbcCD ATPase subunit
MPIVRERDNLVSKNKLANENIEKIDIEVSAKKPIYVDAANKLKEFPDDLKEKHDKYQTLSRTKQRIETEMDKLKTIVSEKLKKLAHLDKHEYDPNCKYCCDNIFVKDAISTRESLAADRTEAKELSDALSNIKTEMEAYAEYVSKYEESVKLKEILNTLTAFISKKELEKTNLKSGVERNDARIKELQDQIELYEKSKEIVESNKAIEDIVNELKIKASNISSKLKNIEKEHMDAYSKKVSAVDQLKESEKQLLTIQQYEDDLSAYQYYISAVGKDGVPYQIISDAIPKIEQEVNNILSHIVEFSVSIETDGKNVNVYIKYEDKKWPLELCSGMEKFISGLALRVALINVSNLPRPNYLVVDEGFSALDGHNIPMLHALFDYLKRNFDFIIIISHLDAMRDMVDKQLEIKKENGFSKIDNTV